MDFLEALFADYFEAEGKFIVVRSTRDPGQPGKLTYYPGIAKLSAAQFPEDSHVFFGVCPREKMDPGLKHIRYCVSLWAGLDLGPDGYSGQESHFSSPDDMIEAIQSFPLDPSIIVRSGQGMHLYWLLDRPIEIPDPRALETVVGILNRHFRCDARPGVGSMLRLPDTVNRRARTSADRCHVEHLDPDLRYGAGDFRGLDLHKPGESAAQKRISPERIDSTGTPGTATNRTLPKISGSAFQTAEKENESAGDDDEVSCQVIEAVEDFPASFTQEDLDYLAEAIADRLGEKFLEGFARKISQHLVDLAVEKVFARLNAGDDEGW
jgi:hypothetical protein